MDRSQHENSSFPVIDISEIDSHSSQLNIAKEITEACSKWGFLLLKNHPIPTASINELFSISHSFFSLPELEKEPWPITSKSIGYMGSFKDRYNDDKMSMWFGGPPGSLTAYQSSIPPFWHEYSQKIEEFKHQCHSLVIKLLQCFALAMDLPEQDFFSKAHDEAAGNGNSLRMLCYPARSSKLADTRMSAHSDTGSVTLLFQTAPGLEVMSPSGEWVQAPCIDDYILINLGDALSFWSGEKLKATFHRVTFDGVPHDRERLSMAYFGKAAPETVLEPVVDRKAREKYVSNGIVLEPGMTVGELTKITMRDIYGGIVEGKVEDKPKEIVV